MSVPSTSKVTSLSGAVRDMVQPGDVIHLAAHHARPNAALYEILRQFDGTRPDFTIVSTGFIGTAGLLVARNLVAEIVTSFIGENYPSPGPNRPVRRQLEKGNVKIESWSMLTLYLRLLGGMLGVPFMPTRSLVGTDTGKNLVGKFLEVADPFSSDSDNMAFGSTNSNSGDQAVGLVSSLSPDISVVHALMADESGNAAILPPWVEVPVGAFASTRGVLVTTEHIVSPEELRRHAHLVKIPQSIVRAVVEVPFGAHPSGLRGPSGGDYRSYGDDYEFFARLRKRSRQADDLDSWIEEWLLAGNHDSYLQRLGPSRLLELTGRAHRLSWEFDFLKDVTWDDDWAAADEGTPMDSEVMAAVASRIIAERARLGGYRTMLSGAGAGNIAAWLAQERLSSEGHLIDLTFEGGTIGFTPTEADPLLTNQRSIPSASMLTDILYALGGVVTGATNSCIGVLSAAEIDVHGNINSTSVPGSSGFITGSGGANDIASGAQEVIVTARQTPGRYPSELNHLTSPGAKVSHVVSEFAVFARDEGKQGELRLVGYIDRGDLPDERAYVERIRANCGWDFSEADQLIVYGNATREELDYLRRHDPRGHVIGDFKNQQLE